MYHVDGWMDGRALRMCTNVPECIAYVGVIYLIREILSDFIENNRYVLDRYLSPYEIFAFRINSLGK